MKSIDYFNQWIEQENPSSQDLIGTKKKEYSTGFLRFWREYPKELRPGRTVKRYIYSFTLNGSSKTSFFFEIIINQLAIEAAPRYYPPKHVYRYMEEVFEERERT